MQDKTLTGMHSVGLEPSKLILIGTRTAYQATGEAGSCMLLLGVDNNAVLSRLWLTASYKQVRREHRNARDFVVIVVLVLRLYYKCP